MKFGMVMQNKIIKIYILNIKHLLVRQYINIFLITAATFLLNNLKFYIHEMNSR